MEFRSLVLLQEELRGAHSVGSFANLNFHSAWWHTPYNPNNQEAEVGGSQVRGQPGLTLSPFKKKKA
jgi:hypothetical protein